MTMSARDILAWMALVVLVAALSDVIARKRSHPWAEAACTACQAPLVLDFLLWSMAMICACVDILARATIVPAGNAAIFTGRVAAAHMIRKTCSPRSP